ncbi:hypothetical protein EJ05DRAFT_526157 [Pseudovirgaria hyperparasitica]|uniref:BTB domain-containing protein n=1 Tax=Pseudovirgaria hyperparasitica TaxID=470096 RepID=A0A6A6WCE0_9PEZI|nr:uncharacterized protein EJ05DRAFT_526157 [Pseudovirgaria hyperparasitica]KAF2759516.1 hypothetical protein EJ05DRAFT_526157 [Pseudovirgaria hyperparasitica]
MSHSQNTNPSPSSLERPSFATLTGTITTIRIGPNRTKYTVHEDLLCQYSTYFRARLRGNFAESGTRAVQLEHITPEVFEAFLDFLYYGRLPTPPEIWFTETDVVSTQPFDRLSIASKDTSDVADPQVSLFEILLIDLYAFADYYDIPALRMALIKSIHTSASASSWIPWFSTVRHAYDILPSNSPLCRLLVEMYAMKYVLEGDDEGERMAAVGVPVEFWVAVVRRLVGERGRGKEEKEDGEGAWMRGVEEFDEL